MMKQIAPALVLLLLLYASCKETSIDTHSAVGEAGTFEESLLMENTERSYILYVPESYDSSSAAPLLLNFHGYTQSASQQMTQIADMRPIADTAGFILVYPQGSLLFGQSHWNVEGWTSMSTADDIGFTAALIDEISSQYHIDSSRIYACGFSNGGVLSYDLACKLSTRIAAIGAVGATMTDALRNSCQPSRPIPVISIHGTGDQVVSYEGMFPIAASSQAELLSYWQNHNQTEPPQVDTLPNLASQAASQVERQLFLNGRSGSAIAHYKVLGGGHDWPESTDNEDIQASLLIWNFLAQFDLEGRIE